MEGIDGPIDFSIKNQSEEILKNPAALIGPFLTMSENQNSKRKNDENLGENQKRRKTSRDEAIDLSFTKSFEGSETSDSGNHSNLPSGDEGREKYFFIFFFIIFENKFIFFF